MTLKLWLRLLPAASVSISVKALAPKLGSATALKPKLPSAATVVLPRSLAAPLRRSATASPACALPSNLTLLSSVLMSPSAPVSLAASSPIVAALGVAVRSCKLTLTMDDALPARSSARSCTT